MIRKVRNKNLWKVVSENTGRSFGTYSSIKKAKVRLKQVEFFKHLDKNKTEDSEVLDLTDIDDYSYSAIVRKLNKKAPKLTLSFLKIYKSFFDRAVKDGLQKPEKIALQKTLVRFNKIKKIKLDKDMIKNAAVSELGEAAVVGKYIANIVSFILNRIPIEKRPQAIYNLRNKIYSINETDLSNKNMPAMASIGQCLTFIKHILFNQNPIYIREVINNIVKSL